MSGITTHVLDTARGRPAAGVPIVLEYRTAGGSFVERGRGVTDADGRVRDFMKDPLEAGHYRITFDTDVYFRANGIAGFYPEVRVVFVVTDRASHHHVPLLLSPFGYSTYRGS